MHVNKGVFTKQKTPANNLSLGDDNICKEERKKDWQQKNMSVFFLKEFFFVCSQIGDHPHKDVEKQRWQLSLGRRFSQNLVINYIWSNKIPLHILMWMNAYNYHYHHHTYKT